MLIGFIGCPKSGKTSIAIRVFDSIKTSGESCELITEQARLFFVKRKLRNPTTPIDDSDQMCIFDEQVSIEIDYLKALSQETTIVSDSSPLNTLWYLSPEGRKKYRTEIIEKLGEWMLYKPLIFHCTPTPGGYGRDENRIHSQSQSEEVNRNIPSILNEFGIPFPKNSLDGPLVNRTNEALLEFYERVLEWPSK